MDSVKTPMHEGKRDSNFKICIWKERYGEQQIQLDEEGGKNIMSLTNRHPCKCVVKVVALSKLLLLLMLLLL